LPGLFTHHATKRLLPHHANDYHSLMKPMKRFPVPVYPPSIGETFSALCESINPHTPLHHLEAELVCYKERILKSKERLAPYHLKTGLALYDRALAILKPMELYSQEHRILVIAAVTYVVRRQDGIDDQRPVVGFEDDVKIINHVLEELEMFSYFILPAASER
jgi:uncharacterized membrane protein YkvA (DUF1232 family)